MRFRSQVAVSVFFIVLAIVMFRCALGGDQVFSGGDANIGLLASARRAGFAGFVGSFGPVPVVGSAGQGALSVAKLGRATLPASVYSDTWYALYLVVASLALVAYLRLWNVRWLSAVFGAVASFWVGSSTLAASGHLSKLGVMALFTVALVLSEKGIRTAGFKRVGYGVLAGLAVGFMLLEQQDVGLLAGLVLGPYILIRLIMVDRLKSLSWLGVLLPICVVGLALSFSTAIKAYTTNVTNIETGDKPESQWEFITQWSMVPAELPDLIAPGYTGWSTGNPDGPYWGACGQSAEWKTTGQGYQNFRLDNLYIGVLPIFLALMAFGVALKDIKNGKRERAMVITIWGCLGIISLLLSFGKFSPLYRLFYELPLVGHIRAPIKFLNNFQVMVGIMAAFGLDWLVSVSAGKEWKFNKWLVGICAVAAIVMFALGLYAQSASMLERFGEWGEKVDAIVGNIGRAWMHAAFMGGVLSIVILVLPRLRILHVGRLVSALFILLVAGDAVYLTGKYYKAENLAELRAGNDVINFLKENQKDDRVFCFSQEGVYNLWIAQDFAYHGVNVFNFGQMPRMPQDLKSFFGAVSNNWVRLTQLTSCRYGLVPASAYMGIMRDDKLREFVHPVMTYRFAMKNGRASAFQIQKPERQGDQVLVRLPRSLPRFALFPGWDVVSDEQACALLGSGEFDPESRVLVSSSTPMEDAESVEAKFLQVRDQSVGRREAVVEVESETGGVLLFVQRFQPGWRVEVDGRPAPLLQCNFLNMGVHVSAGSHTIVFKCPRKPFQLIVQLAVVLLAVVSGGLMLKGGYPKGSEE
ncbi:MAG: hypothetical protein V3V05_10000 [Pontiella sp.]